MTPAGMVLFDKPQGWTSHDAAEAFRRMLPRGTKVGHCGTLDPLATGLLMLLVGPCTRLQSHMQGLGKVYSGKVRLGVATDTGDITGKVIEEREVPPLTLERIQEVLDGHVGAIAMNAPAYSAVKHQGQALYKYARRGIPVPPKPRRSVVHEWKALSYTRPDFRHRLSCGSGTYVRSLAESAGRALGCGATVSSLRRESVGEFSLEGALTLEQAKGLELRSLQAMLTASLPLLEAVAKSA